MARPFKKHAHILWYDEVSGEPMLQTTHEGKKNQGKELKLTRGDDDKLIKELYAETPEDEDMIGSDEGPDWTVVAIVHTPRTTTVEWKSGRGHCSISLIYWL